jgi:hypothetical protein
LVQGDAAGSSAVVTIRRKQRSHALGEADRSGRIPLIGERSGIVQDEDQAARRTHAITDRLKMPGKWSRPPQKQIINVTPFNHQMNANASRRSRPPGCQIPTLPEMLQE